MKSLALQTYIYIYLIYIYIFGLNRLKPFLLKQEGHYLDDSHDGPGPSIVLHDFTEEVLDIEDGDIMQWGRSYQICNSGTCKNWIWEDKIQAGFTCRLCGSTWKKPSQGYASKAQQVKHLTRWNAYKARSPTPPPGLGKGKPGKSGKLQKVASDILAPAWEGLDEALRSKLIEVGINPNPKQIEPDLTDVLKENLANLPAPVKELVEKITKPQPPTEKDMAVQLKQQVTNLRDISHRKQILQQKIDSTKKHYQDLLEEMKQLQQKLEQEQASLNATSAAYMTKVKEEHPPGSYVLDVEMKDTVPEAVAGFITTLGVSLTPEQKEQLQQMLKRPQSGVEGTDEEAKRRRTGAPEALCG